MNSCTPDCSGTSNTPFTHDRTSSIHRIFIISPLVQERTFHKRVVLYKTVLGIIIIYVFLLVYIHIQFCTYLCTQLQPILIVIFLTIEKVFLSSLLKYPTSIFDFICLHLKCDLPLVVLPQRSPAFMQRTSVILPTTILFKFLVCSIRVGNKISKVYQFQVI